jgi:fatty acid desaturase
MIGPFNPHGIGIAWTHIAAEVIAGLFFIVVAVVVIGVLFFLVRFLIVSTRAAEIYIREHEPKQDAAAAPPATTTTSEPVVPPLVKPVTKAPPRLRTPKTPPAE